MEKMLQRKMTGSELKLIAIVTMFLDHFGAAVLGPYLLLTDPEQKSLLFYVYFFLRMAGRMSYPLFVFLLVEGFSHTRNRWNYLARLVLFALISEIPFDLAFCLTKDQVNSGVFLEFSCQNIFFTLAIGFVTIMAMDFFLERAKHRIGRYGGSLFALAAGMALAGLLRTDYAETGVLAIAVMYLFRSDRMRAAFFTCAVLLLSGLEELPAFFVLKPVLCYNGERGWKQKWFFYCFYPLHLLLLWLICYFI